MAEKSIEFKIGADISDFQKSMKAADKEVSNFSKNANYLEKGLKIDFDASNFKQAQASAQKALELTNTKAQKLREELAYLEKSGNVNTADYKKLQTELAKTDTKALELKAKLNEINNLKFTNASASVEKLGNSLTKAGRSMTALSAAAVAAIAGIAKLTQTATQNADDILTLSASYDLSTESIQKWSYVATMAGIDSDQMYKAIQKVNNALGEQLLGTTSTATQTLDKLGISVSQFGGDTDAAFTSVLEALAGISDSTERAAIATDIFGEKVATSIIAVVSQGSDAIADYVAEFEQVGYLTDDTLDSLGTLDNQLDRLKIEFQNLAGELVSALMPVISAFTSFVEDSVVPALQSFSDWLGNLSTGQQEFLVGALAVVAALAPLLIILGQMATGISAIIKLMPTLLGFVKSFNASTLSTLATITALAGAMGLVVDLISNWSSLTTIQKVLKGLAASALAAAAAIMVFHSTWSLGTAMTGILAGIAMASGAILAIASEYGIDTKDSEANLSGGTSAITSANDTSTASTTASAGSTSSVTTDNSVTTINVNVEGTDATADEIADAVSKALATQVQART